MNEDEWQKARQLIKPGVGGFGEPKSPTEEDIRKAKELDLVD